MDEDLYSIFNKKFMEIYQEEVNELRKFNKEWIDFVRMMSGARPIDWKENE